MIVLYVVLAISILGILKVLNKLQTVFFLTLALIYYLLKFTNTKVLTPFLDDVKSFTTSTPVYGPESDDCVECEIPKDVYMANKRYANFPTLNVDDRLGWGDPAFSSAGGGANSKIEMPEVGNPRFAWKQPSPEWYGW